MACHHRTQAGVHLKDHQVDCPRLLRDHQANWPRLPMVCPRRGSSGSKRSARGRPGSSWAEWSWRRESECWSTTTRPRLPDHQGIRVDTTCRRLPVRPGRRPPRTRPGRRPPRAHLTKARADPRLQRPPRAARRRLRHHRPRRQWRRASFSDRPSPRATGPARRLPSRQRVGTSAGPTSAPQVAPARSRCLLRRWAQRRAQV